MEELRSSEAALSADDALEGSKEMARLIRRSHGASLTVVGKIDANNRERAEAREVERSIINCAKLASRKGTEHFQKV